MIEVQALVSSAVYGTPQRSATGFNSKRLNMILAILEKRAGIQIGSKDVFLFSLSSIRLSTRTKPLDSSNRKDTGKGQISISQSTPLFFMSFEYIAHPSSMSASKINSYLLSEICSLEYVQVTGS